MCAWITIQAACSSPGEKKRKESAITLSFGSIFFQLLLPFVFLSSSLFFSLPGYDLCADSGSGTFSAALARGYFRSVAFQVVHSTLPVSDVVTLCNRNKVFPAQTSSIALNQETFINCRTTFFPFSFKGKYLFTLTFKKLQAFKFFRGSV